MPWPLLSLMYDSSDEAPPVTAAEIAGANSAPSVGPSSAVRCDTFPRYEAAASMAPNNTIRKRPLTKPFKAGEMKVVICSVYQSARSHIGEDVDSHCL